MKPLARKVDILCFASAGFTAKIDFRLTSVTKYIFSKIQLLRWKDAVFTVERQIHMRIYSLSGIMSLGRTISAQFKVKVRFTHFLTDPPLGTGHPGCNFPIV